RPLARAERRLRLARRVQPLPAMTTAPPVKVFDDAASLAAAAARHIAAALSDAAAERGRATLAVSGGRTPLAMLERLAGERVPWDRLDVFQVDERVAPAGHPDRNATILEAALGAQARARPE